MIDLIEQHILERLRLITYNGEPIPVYGPGADRPKDETGYPCIAVTEHLDPAMDVKRARPHLEVFEASEEQGTVEIPIAQGGGEKSGPVSWTVKRHPTPMDVYYQVELLATKKAHIRGLQLGLLEAIPVPYKPDIDGRHVLILPTGDPVNLDERDKPVFRRVHRYEVCHVWVDRKAEYTVPSIVEVALETEIEEEA